jgi:hypothetical protein
MSQVRNAPAAHNRFVRSNPAPLIVCAALGAGACRDGTPPRPIRAAPEAGVSTPHVLGREQRRPSDARRHRRAWLHRSGVMERGEVL